jgi:hypothetical protein
MNNLIPIERIEKQIFYIRKQKVMIDSDLASLYEVKTKRLNEQVKRNRGRFPENFMFQLNKDEKNEVVANCDHLENLKYSPALPYAFTEHGVVMLASVLNSEVAISVSIQIVNTFINLRTIALNHKELMTKINSMEKKYDHQFKVIFNAIRGMMEPPENKNKKIGFLRK